MKAWEGCCATETPHIFRPLDKVWDFEPESVVSAQGGLSHVWWWQLLSLPLRNAGPSWPPNARSCPRLRSGDDRWVLWGSYTPPTAAYHLDGNYSLDLWLSCNLEYFSYWFEWQFFYAFRPVPLNKCTTFPHRSLERSLKKWHRFRMVSSLKLLESQIQKWASLVQTSVLLSHKRGNC